MKAVIDGSTMSFNSSDGSGFVPVIVIESFDLGMSTNCMSSNIALAVLH